MQIHDLQHNILITAWNIIDDAASTKPSVYLGRYLNITCLIK